MSSTVYLYSVPRGTLEVLTDPAQTRTPENLNRNDNDSHLHRQCQLRSVLIT